MTIDSGKVNICVFQLSSKAIFNFQINTMESSAEKELSESASESASTSSSLRPSGETLKRPTEESNDSNRKSPAKKLRLDPSLINRTPEKKPKTQFIYGNYNRYYNYRHPSDVEDVRLVAFREHLSFFAGKDILDIGCNEGAVTIAVARDLGPRSITGIDIDKGLIGRARKKLVSLRQTAASNNNLLRKDDKSMPFPFNVGFDHCNYVLSDDRLLELEEPKFDAILCLSVAKWIHLNFGDAGLKRAFRRMFNQLKPGGCLVFEAQNWKSYKRRKNLTPAINTHFKSIQLFPNKFDEYLLSAEVGFARCSEIALPEHPIKGFQRPIKVFHKETKTEGSRQKENDSNRREGAG